jgi:hypothetical protein
VDERGSSGRYRQSSSRTCWRVTKTRELPHWGARTRTPTSILGLGGKQRRGPGRRLVRRGSGRQARTRARGTGARATTGVTVVLVAAVASYVIRPRDGGTRDEAWKSDVSCGSWRTTGGSEISVSVREEDGTHADSPSGRSRGVARIVVPGFWLARGRSHPYRIVSRLAPLLPPRA